MPFKPHVCGLCRRRFSTRHGFHDHNLMKHGGRAELRAPKRREDHDDDSLADRAVQATIDRASGIPNPDIDLFLD